MAEGSRRTITVLRIEPKRNLASFQREVGLLKYDKLVDHDLTQRESDLSPISRNFPVFISSRIRELTSANLALLILA